MYVLKDIREKKKGPDNAFLETYCTDKKSSLSPFISFNWSWRWVEYK